jgi:hypothetical protein
MFINSLIPLLQYELCKNYQRTLEDAIAQVIRIDGPNTRSGVKPRVATNKPNRGVTGDGVTYSKPLIAMSAFVALIINPNHPSLS